MALAYALTTWPHLKAFLRNEEADQLEMEELIDAATIRIEQRCRRALVQRSFTQDVTGSNGSGRGGAERIYLDNFPIVSVTSIEDDNDNTVASDEYEIIGAEGILEHHTTWPAPLYRWHVTYVAGLFASVDAVEANARTACHELVAWVFNRPRVPVTSQSDDVGKSRIYQIMDTAELPPQVEMWLAPYLSPLVQ